MVSTVSILCMCITLILSLLLPIVFLIIMLKGRKGVFSIWIIGALGFIIPQLVIRIPVLQVLGIFDAFKQFATSYPYLYVFLLALTAGLFETTGRLVVLKKALADRLSYMTGLISGAGHGGIESMMIVGITYINNLVLTFFINTDKLSLIIPDSALVESIRKPLVDMPPYFFLMAGFERVFTMIFHTALSILLALFIIRKKAVLGYLLVTFLHFATDFLAGIMQIQGASVIAIEGVILIIAIVSLIFIIKIRLHFNEEQSAPSAQGDQAVIEGN